MKNFFRIKEIIALGIPLITVIMLTLIFPPAPFLDEISLKPILIWGIFGAIWSASTWSWAFRSNSQNIRNKKDKKNKMDFGYITFALITMYFHLLASHCLIEKINGNFDSTLPKQHKVRLVRIDTEVHNGGRGSAYKKTYAYVESWRKNGGIEKIPLFKKLELKQTLNPSHITIDIRAGFLGIAWISSYSLFTESRTN